MSNRAKGTLCILMAALSFALMNTFVRLSGDVPPCKRHSSETLWLPSSPFSLC